MKKSRFLERVMAMLLTFIAVLSFSSEVFAINVSEQRVQELRDKMEQAGPFEMALTDLALTVGDFIMEYSTFLLKEEITVQKIIYNQVEALNANFFENSENPSDAPATAIIREIVNEWYDILSQIVIIIYLIALVAVGIRILMGTASQKVEAKELFMKWTMGIIIFFFFPYVMRYAFDLNEGIIRTMQSLYGGSGTYLGDVSDLRSKEFELRSPEYTTRSTYLLTLGSEDATNAYIKNYEEYRTNGDMMRIVRALAGITGRIIYVIIWFMMMWQLLVFIYIYYKRYLMIAFLITIFPITIIEYVIGTVSTGKQSAITAWSKEFFVNVFLQSIHAVIYAIISSVIMNQIVGVLQSDGVNKMNWFLMIVAVNFVFVAEKMLRDIISAVTDTVKNPEDEPGKARKDVLGLGKDFKKMVTGK